MPRRGAAGPAAAGRAAGHSAREYITEHFSRAAADGGISLAERAGLALDMDGTTDAAAAAFEEDALFEQPLLEDSAG